MGCTSRPAPGGEGSEPREPSCGYGIIPPIHYACEKGPELLLRSGPCVAVTCFFQAGLYVRPVAKYQTFS